MHSKVALSRKIRTGVDVRVSLAIKSASGEMKPFMFLSKALKPSARRRVTKGGSHKSKRLETKPGV